LSITDFINNDLYPTLYNSIDRAFPEHDFKQGRQGWTSKAYLNGDSHKDRRDKTVISAKVPSRIMEQGGESLSLVDYVMRRDGVEFIEAVKTLADVVGLKVPSNGISEEAYKKDKRKQDILERAQRHFKSRLYLFSELYDGMSEVGQVRPLNSLTTYSTQAHLLINYLKDRGYSLEDIKEMELGYIKSQRSLKSYLKEKGGFTEKEIAELKLNEAIGKSHILTIPYRSGGKIKGFKFRTIGEEQPKYLNSTGLDKGGLFNLKGIKGDKDLVIVEGELDSLHATVKGIDNVVALGGSALTTEQVQDAIKRGAKSFTLCFDREASPEKQRATERTVLKAIETITELSVNRVYIVNLPALEGRKTDPDRLIKEQGIEALQKAIKEAQSYYIYQLMALLNEFAKKEQKDGITARDVDNFLDKVVETAIAIKDPIDRDRFKTAFLSIEGLRQHGITEEAISITIDRLTQTRDKERQDREVNKLLSKARDLHKSGDNQKALDLLEQNLREVRLQDKETEYGKLLSNPTQEEIREAIQNKPEPIKTGYTIQNQDLLLPTGALSYLVAPTSHGKTTFLLNLALRVAERLEGKKVYFFSYEEDTTAITIKALNTYIDESLSAKNKNALKHYISTGSTKFIKESKREIAEQKAQEFFKTLIETNRLNIKYSNYNSGELTDAIRYLHKTTDVGAVFIDYIQLLNLPKGKHKTYSRQEELKQIGLDLKDLAVETELPIIMGAQFNRQVTNLKHIHATKIGEAGDIERQANLILGFWNNDFKHTGADVDISQINSEGLDEAETLYVEVLKNRDGRVGAKELLGWNGNKGTVKNNHNKGFK